MEIYNAYCLRNCRPNENFGTSKLSHRVEKYEKTSVREYTDLPKRTVTHQCCLTAFFFSLFVAFFFPGFRASAHRGLIFLDQSGLPMLDQYTGSQPPTLMSDASTCSYLADCFSHSLSHPQQSCDV